MTAQELNNSDPPLLPHSSTGSTNRSSSGAAEILTIYSMYGGAPADTLKPSKTSPKEKDRSWEGEKRAVSPPAVNGIQNERLSPLNGDVSDYETARSSPVIGVIDTSRESTELPYALDSESTEIKPPTRISLVPSASSHIQRRSNLSASSAVPFVPETKSRGSPLLRGRSAELKREPSEDGSGSLKRPKGPRSRASSRSAQTNPVEHLAADVSNPPTPPKSLLQTRSPSSELLPGERRISSPNILIPSSETSVSAHTSEDGPAEGEDQDSYFVRSTYALLDVTGVKGDGVSEGVERTRARLDNKEGRRRGEQAVADGSEKHGELSADEIQLLTSLDRYGFFNTPSHDRLVLLPTRFLAKPLTRYASPPRGQNTLVTSLKAVPPIKVSPKEQSRTAKWSRMLVPGQRDGGGNVVSWDVRPAKRPKLKERVYKGIPDCWRAAAWSLLVHERSKRKLQSASNPRYRELTEQPSSYDIQIDLDVPRTISGHVMFRTRYGVGQRSLFHVLHAFSLTCTSCGYCQGMGPLAATLLCYNEPQRVFDLLVRLHDNYKLHGIFSPGFPGLLEAIYVQERFTEKMMPSVYDAFKRHTISTTSYATKWYITLFANSIPFQTQLRLWDIFLVDGGDVFIVTALAMVWTFKDLIVSPTANFETILSLLSSFFVPEDEDTLILWIQNVMFDKGHRDAMSRWRSQWTHLVETSQDANVLL